MHAVRQVGQEAFAVICRCRFHGRNLRTRVLAGVHGLSFMPGKALPAREPCKGAHQGYRPELHYMRGPGPKWREAHVRLRERR